MFSIISISIVIASLGAGLTFYNLLAIGPRNAFSAIAGLSVLSVGLALLFLVFSVAPPG